MYGSKRKNDENFKWEKDPDFDFVLSEGSNNAICLRKISWNDRPFKIDIRKYTYQDNEEHMGKGISLEDDAVDNLVEILSSNGYGSTINILKGIKDREDFEEAYQHMNDPENTYVEDGELKDYYDPNELLNEDREEIV